MPLMFNTILREVGLALADIRLLRHQDRRATRGHTPYELWRDDPRAFDDYQSTQSFLNRSRFGSAGYWASFVVPPDDTTLFAGLYRVGQRRLLDRDWKAPHNGQIDRAGSCDIYDLTSQDQLRDLIGKLVIRWGSGTRSWLQRADRQDKEIIEIRAQFEEPEFPGLLGFIEPLSKIKVLPRSWITALSSAKGVYLLTCPRTREQYVGEAKGEQGFLQRWLEYAETGHGGNVKLKSREPSDYQVSILEVAGTSSDDAAISKMESRWKQKLQSRDMGLNGN